MSVQGLLRQIRQETTLEIVRLIVPGITPTPDAWEYFWFHLPVALPGLFSFAFCTFFAFSGFYVWLRDRRNFFMLNFMLMSLGMGALGLILALRALVQDLELLLLLHRIVYPIALLLTGGAMGFNYHLMERRYRIIRYTTWLLWGTIALGTYGLITGKAFTGKWHHYWFGSYPVGSVFLTPWGISGVLGLFVVVVPAMFFFRKTGRNLFRDPIGIGVNLTCLTIGLNLPSLTGVPLFPGANFMFVPMALIAYGVFKKDFFSLNRLLFEKRLLYYLIAFLISVFLLGTGILLMLTLPPRVGSVVYTNPLTFIPVLSGLIVFSLAIYLAGSNPQSRVHMMGALSMMLTGFFTILLTVESLRLPLLINLRLDQLIYLIFAFTPIVQYRFIYLLLELDTDWRSRIIDVLSLIAALLTLTPFFITDFYEYGGIIRTAGASFGLTLLSLVGGYSLALIAWRWFHSRRRADRSIVIIVAALMLGAAFMLTNVPGTQGISFPPLGALQFIPAGMIAFAILRYRAIVIRGEATRIANRFQLMSLVGVGFLVFVYARTLPEGLETIKIWNHLSVIAASLLLGFSMLLFVLVRPVAAAMDDSFHLLDEQKKQLEESEKNLREIADVSRSVYASVNLNGIIDLMFAYVQQRFGIEGLWLTFCDTAQNRIYHVRHNADTQLPRETLGFMEQFSVDLTPDAGLLYHTWQRKRITYMRRLACPDKMAELDRILAEKLDLKGYVHVPLVLQNEVIAVLMGMNFGKKLHLSPKDLRSLELFAGQIAGALSTARLLKEINQEKKKSDELLLNILPRGIADQLKERGEVTPQFYDSVTILFTDFVGFTRSALTMVPTELIEQLNRIFYQFDAITRRYNLEKIKTIGDSYMAAGGLPEKNATHYLDVCLAALEIVKMTEQVIAMSGGTSTESWQLRVGIHTGPVMAGVVGQYKFVYDIFGDAVNVASRMETTSEAARINISADTYHKVKFFFDCEYRGRIHIRNRGEVEMYFLNGLKPRFLTKHGAPNAEFREIYEKIRNGARIEPRKRDKTSAP
ncbi:MAG TPA: adenylate/guanylate cyclase domain-containing protein [Turneriella sp.]|nr:adenylate/guanylate cyclase domain-containing protein [Turneriella sp.]